MHFDFTLPGEIWKDVVGYEGRYLVSNLGRVVSLAARHTPLRLPGGGFVTRYYPRAPRLMVPYERKEKLGTRQYVILSKDSKVSTWSVAVLVLTAFVGPKPPGMECCHFPDRDTSNNRADNLRWGTHRENMEQRDLHDTTAYGTRHPIAKLDADKVREIRRLYAAGGIGYSTLGREFGVNVATIRDIVVRRTWKRVT